ncbi:capsule biosynthesis protein [Roseobacter sp.]|uniref:capsule biosynthesis protein n=1 Tax=Roseobacter sp. TaxID=1907202 RepID=UPI00385EB30D
MTSSNAPSERVFLFLQGPHGPFFSQLSKQLQHAGAKCWRIGFNAGDQVYWSDRTTFLPFRDRQAAWTTFFNNVVTTKSVTDIVVYADTRWMHVEAIAKAKTRNITVHVFEEGYLRPYWVSYELGGSNGHSALMNMPLAAIRNARAQTSEIPPMAPSHWGDMRQHIFYGALYHWFVMFWNRKYKHFCPHRDLNVVQEFKLYVKRLVFTPFQSLERRISTYRLRRGGFPYHLALLQLEHDSSFQNHGPFAKQSEFLEEVISEFARGAPVHHHLVFKAHPLEDGRAPIKRDIRRFAETYDLVGRVHFLRGGKLAGILSEARSAVTVNSTAGQQALWRGIPLKVFGTAVYDKPGLVSHQPLRTFFAKPDRGDRQAYFDFRQFLLETSQLPGSYYSALGRRQLLRQVTEMMLEGCDPYQIPRQKTEAIAQQLRVVHAASDAETVDFARMNG